ncbi:MAG: type II toxin-antitoxin system HicB family antitoxin [Anaerolineae bacterium]
MATYKLPVILEQQGDGWWEARCPAIQGFRVEGRAIGEVLEELPKVAQALWEFCQDKGQVFVTDHPEIKLNDIIWQLELPQKRRVA